MGWDFARYKNRLALIDYITKQWYNEKKEEMNTCIHWHASNNTNIFVLWSVWEIVEKSGKARRFIGCDLIRGQKGYFGHKSLCERMSPFYYSCPLEYFDIVEMPEINQSYDGHWRDEVRAWHQNPQKEYVEPS